MRVPLKRRDERPTQAIIVYLPNLDINYFCHFLDILENYNPVDDEPMWAADRVIALTPGSAITIPKTVNEFTIKTGGIFLYKTPNQAYQLLEDKVLLKLDWAKNQKTKSSLKKIVSFADEGSSNSDTSKIMARMDMTMKIDAQYKEMQSHSNHSIPEYDEDDKPMSPEAEAKFMQTFRAHVLTMITAIVTQIAIIGVQAGETIIIEINIDSTLMINPTFKDNQANS
nr:reverse transcriptase domain-containing protein [Tanacetum cinerariifolium]